MTETQALMATLNASPRRAPAPRLWRRLLRKPEAVVSIVFLGVVTAIGVIYPRLRPDVVTQFAGDATGMLSGPSSAHWLGTDGLGRDVFERLLAGAGPTMEGVGITVLVVLLLGMPIGMIAGFFGGRVDAMINWGSDLVLSLPGLIIQLVVLAVYPANQWLAMGAFGILYAPRLARIVRSVALSVREELYVDAAIVSGVSWTFILTRHVLPRVTGSVVVQMAIVAGIALQVQTGLAFLGLLVPAPAPSWGGLIADGISNIALQPWLIWPAGLATVLTTLAFGVLADSLRDAGAEGWSRQGSRLLLAARRRPASGSGKPAVGAAPPEDAGPGSDVLLAVEDFGVAVTKPSGGETLLVEGVRFEVAPGEIVGLVGESGCGKTTTATAVMGLLPDGAHVTSGHIWYGGRDLTALSEAELRRIRGKEIALVSQEPMVSLNPAFRIGWQLAEVVRRHQSGLSRADAERRAVDLLRSVHLPDPEQVARRYPHELSGGMAQRVSIARALAGDPDLLIADEPTTALDVTVQAEILDLLREIRHERGMAILLITHDWGVLADMCDRAVVMYAGQVVEDASIEAVFTRPLHPYTTALLEANPQHGAAEEMLPTIPGVVPSPGDWPVGCHFEERCGHATAACGEHGVPLEIPAPGRLCRCIHVDRPALLTLETVDHGGER
ncbi:dipeptide/oligopeptide/nickel ABC transporter permease/ATP-binding protein [Saccharomonospora sp. NPDC046836]|uniref:dipeptide/oligopeptide/nickel ABC transporter permease/ATP-binding protein n=1 Tax=Saccharomonospora sp. NPDC046836 TaxID=3156921 RepID=UPI0033C73815